MLGEKDENRFEETSSETDQQIAVAIANHVDQTSGKIEKTDQSEELSNSEKESGNDSSGANKLESIFEDENEGKEVVDDVSNKHVNSKESFEGSDWTKRGEMREKERKKEELVFLREVALAKAVLFITRQVFTISMNRFAFTMINIHLCGCQA